MVIKKGQNGYNCLHKSLIETHKHLAIILEDGVTEDGVPRSPSASPEILTPDEGIEQWFSIIFPGGP